MPRRKAGKRTASRTSAPRPSATTQPADPPPRERLATGRSIRIGAVERLAGGRELRCVVDGNCVVVAVYDADRACEPRLSISPARGSLAVGRSFDEGEFSRVLDSYRVHSPWHDGEFTCLVLTIDCLRRGDAHELMVFKDL